MDEARPLVMMVEDNEDVLRLNRKWLTRAGYDTLSASSLRKAAQALSSHDPDIILLDVLLPDGNGLDFLPTLKGLTDAPVLFLSACKEHEDVLAGLAAGGDDYICKPYRVEELVGRVDALWRRERRYSARQDRYAWGPLRLDIGAMRAYVHGRDALLTPREFAILLQLVRAHGEVVAASALYHAAWGMNAIDSSSALRKQISRIRTKLQQCEPEAISIETDRGSGYFISFRP